MSSSSQNTRNGVSELQNFKLFLGKMPPDPLSGSPLWCLHDSSVIKKILRFYILKRLNSLYCCCCLFGQVHVHVNVVFKPTLRGSQSFQKPPHSFVFFISALCILLIHFLLKTKFHYLPESVAVVFLGKFY